MNAPTPVQTGAVRLTPSVHPAPARLVTRKLFVTGLTLEASIGIYAHEHSQRQPLVIDVEMDSTLHAISDLNDTINYETVVTAARAQIEAGHIELVETFAEDLAQTLMADPRAIRVRVRISKPKALAGTTGAGCEVEMSRD
ncbi:MAG: dihydroneopterin aldolase [Asticcacaulis sp.]